VVGTPSRKLAVILHADVVDSTLLVQQDESVAHERIRDTFKRFSTTISSYDGVVHEIRGDALVAEFRRASDAVCAALAFQSENSIQNTTLSDGIVPVLRIGISLSEVVVADGTVTGAGVVLAQRLEQLCSPGSVVVQGSITETVPTRLPLQFLSMGTHELKGLNQPVRVFNASVDADQMLPGPESEKSVANSRKNTSDEITVDSTRNLQDIPAIAVLPFVNMSGDPDQEYFSDGITEDIITELTRFRSLSVVARNSSFAYKGLATKIQEIAADLGAGYIVEGSVRKSGQRLRITAQLIESLTGNHVWAQKYDREMKDIFEVQDEVTRSIVATVGGRLQDHQALIRKRNSFSDWSVYDLVLRAQELHYRIQMKESHQALQILIQAVEKDPENPRIYSLMGAVELLDYVLNWSEHPLQRLQRALEHGRKSVQLDNSDSLAHARLAETLIHFDRLDESKRHFEMALERNPNDAESLALYAIYYMATGDPDRSLQILSDVRKMDPYEQIWIPWLRGEALLLSGKYKEAIASFEEVTEPINDIRLSIAACASMSGDTEAATAMLTEYISNARHEMPGFPGSAFSDEWVRLWTASAAYQSEDHRTLLIEAIRKAWPVCDS
jgi:adenylate cyclase